MCKKVGVIPLFDEYKDSIWMVPGYMDMLEEAGAIPMILPLTTNEKILDYFIDNCDGFLLTGGHDVDPRAYNEEKSVNCGAVCSKRDVMEKYILERAVEKDKAVLGICRGIQLMNVVFGGDLYQDLPTEFDSSIEHHMEPPYDRVAHSVKILPNTTLWDIFEKNNIGVNSYHHQAIKNISPLFQPMAISEDGLIEAIKMRNRSFIIGVQWHPEFYYKRDENSRKLVSAFVSNL